MFKINWNRGFYFSWIFLLWLNNHPSFCSEINKYEGVGLNTSFASIQPISGPPFPRADRCGGVFTEDAGTIAYKVEESPLPNERCVWIISTANCTIYEIQTKQLGSDPEEENLIIVGLKPITANIEVQYYVPQGVETRFMTANTIMVTFQTGSDVENVRGFSLYFISILGEIPYVNPDSTNRIVEPTTPFFKHPPEGETYLGYELSTFLFPPVNNIYDENGKRNIVYVRGGLEYCQDAIYIYHFNGQRRRWDYRGNICNGTETSIITGYDMLLLVFRSDCCTENIGFSIGYSVC